MPPSDEAIVLLILVMADAVLERDRESLRMVLRLSKRLTNSVSEDQQWARHSLGKLWAVGLTAFVAIDLLDDHPRPAPRS